MAWIEAQVIHQAVRKGALAESVRSVESQYPGHVFGDGVYLETRIACLLYCLILFPKEIWPLEKPDHDIYDLILHGWCPENKVMIIKDESKYKDEKNLAFKFVYHLRNAVAHANFCIANGVFEFCDKAPWEKEFSFIASISTTNLEDFLNVAGRMLANLGSDELAQKTQNGSRGGHTS